MNQTYEFRSSNGLLFDGGTVTSSDPGFRVLDAVRAVWGADCWLEADDDSSERDSTGWVVTRSGILNGAHPDARRVVAWVRVQRTDTD